MLGFDDREMIKWWGGYLARLEENRVSDGGRAFRWDRPEWAAALRAQSMQGWIAWSHRPDYAPDGLRRRRRLADEVAVLALRGRWETGWLESWDGLV